LRLGARPQAGGASPVSGDARSPADGDNRAVKRTGVVILLVLATLLWTVGIVAVWAQRQMLDTQNWVQTSDRLLENQQIREALSTAILQRVYASAPVETKLRDTLPPNLKPLAAPIAAGLREVANRNAPKVLGSAAAQVAWEKANRTAHRELLKVLNGAAARSRSTCTTSSRRSPPAPACPPGSPIGCRRTCSSCRCSRPTRSRPRRRR
jgi:hypothetical protein